MAKTFTFDAEKCRVDVPDDWKQQDVPGNKLATQSPDESKAAILRIVEVGSGLGIDNTSFADGLEKSVTAVGATIKGRSKSTFAGMESRIWDAETKMPAGLVYTRMIVVMANGEAYALVLQKLGEKPEQDEQLNAIAQSFAFIGTPEPQHPVDPNDARAEKIGAIVGGLVGVLAAFVTIKWLLPMIKRTKPDQP